MFRPSRSWMAVGALALVAASAGAWRARDLGPRLEFAVERMPTDGDVTPFRLRIMSRGGEVMEQVSIEPAGPWIEFYGPRAARGLRPGVEMVTTLRVRAAGGPARLTVVQAARVERRYEIDLAERAR